MMELYMYSLFIEEEEEETYLVDLQPWIFDLKPMSWSL